MEMTVVTLAERPDLMDEMWSLPNTWPTFMRQDPIGNLYYGKLAESFPELQLLALDEQSTVIGKAHSVPMQWDGSWTGFPIAAGMLFWKGRSVPIFLPWNVVQPR